MSPEQLEQLWPHAHSLTWPQMRGISPGHWWQSITVLYWIYGFRLQDLYGFHTAAHPLKWDSVRWDPLTPNPESEATWELGWLTYTPSKTRRVRPIPLYLPLHPLAVHALRRLEAARIDDRVAPAPKSGRDFYKTWRKWQRLGGVTDRRGNLLTPYCFRKSAATELTAHHRGLAEAVIGWATGGSKEDISKVAAEVYTSTEPLLLRYLPTYKLPACCDSIRL